MVNKRVSRLLIGLVPACFLIIGQAQAERVLFDPDGNFGPDPAIEIDAFDFAPGNVVSKNAVTAVGSGVGGTFQTYSHATLGAFTKNGLPIPTSGTLRLNAAYEFTYVMGYGEIVSSQGDINANGFKEYANFDRDGAAPSFFELWFSPVDSNALAGTGYNNGVRVLRGRVVRAFGNFLVDESTVPPPALGGTPQILDGFGVDNYGLSTVAGSGSGHPLTIEVLEWDTRFFPDPKFHPANILSFNIQVLNASINIPFVSVDPSQQFVGAAGGVGAPSVSWNVGAVNGATGPDVLFQTDTNAVIETIQKSDDTCRMTGGGVTYTGDIVYDVNGNPVPTATAGTITGKGKNAAMDRYQFGGQIGAPSASQPQPFGEWTHHQQSGPSGDFVFHAGTHSAPAETKVLKVSCYDPGYCQPARPAPFKQLNWEGIGQFKNAKNLPSSMKDVVPGVSLHYVRVHYEDIGEPGGPNGAQTKNANCPTSRVIGSVIGDPKTSSTAAQICMNCPDVYQISIYAKATNPATDPSNKPIYQVGGYIDHGNIQLHPAIK